MDISKLIVEHDKDCFWADLPEGLCECMKRKLLDLFSLLDNLIDENNELKIKLDKRNKNP
jgi:hypothetical protein